MFAIIACGLTALVPWTITLTAAIVSVGSWAIYRKWQPGLRMIVGLFVSFLIVCVYMGLSGFVREQVKINHENYSDELVVRVGAHPGNDYTDNKREIHDIENK